jgi:hypothetical protein
MTPQPALDIDPAAVQSGAGGAIRGGIATEALGVWRELVSDACSLSRHSLEEFLELGTLNVRCGGEESPLSVVTRLDQMVQHGSLGSLGHDSLLKIKTARPRPVTVIA